MISRHDMTRVHEIMRPVSPFSHYQCVYACEQSHSHASGALFESAPAHNDKMVRHSGLCTMTITDGDER